MTATPLSKFIAHLFHSCFWIHLSDATILTIKVGIPSPSVAGNILYQCSLRWPEAGLRMARPRLADMDWLTCQRGKNDRLSDKCPAAGISRAINFDQSSHSTGITLS